jgi:hypothetical protein
MVLSREAELALSVQIQLSPWLRFAGDAIVVFVEFVGISADR